MQTQRMEKLAQSFPSLKQARGVSPWQSKELARWAREHRSATLERTAAQFVLWVCDPFEVWRCGRFNLLEALVTWDEPHRAAFIAWAKSPWWP